MRKMLLGLTSLLWIVACCSIANATPIDLGYVYTGDTPDGSPAWLSADLSLNSGSNYTLTLTSHLSGGDVLKGLKNSSSNLGWGFYIANASNISNITYVSGQQAAHAGFASGGYNAGPVSAQTAGPSGGIFNLAFGWNNNSPYSPFAAGDTAVYTLDIAGSNPMLTASVAHIQNIGGGNCSGWVTSFLSVGSDGGQICGSASVPNVPEPSELPIMLLGLALLGGLYLRHRIRGTLNT